MENTIDIVNGDNSCWIFIVVNWSVIVSIFSECMSWCMCILLHVYVAVCLGSHPFRCTCACVRMSIYDDMFRHFCSASD